MDVETTIIETDNFLSIKIVGNWTIDTSKVVIEMISEEAQKRSHKRILLDLREYAGKRSDWDRFQIGKYAAEKWRYPNFLKVAVIDLKENITRFAENTAVNRGGYILVESDYENAEKWLVSD